MTARISNVQGTRSAKPGRPAVPPARGPGPRAGPAAIEAVMAAERALGRAPVLMPEGSQGYDIESRTADGATLFICVKARGNGDSFTVTRGELGVVARTLSGIAVGPLTGDVAPPERQAMIDQFTTRNGPAVLVSQIQAGGVGLNIQAASVVIITEPQMTPAAEDQAIARAHRMGQVRRVDVHRLLAEDSVDARMLELLHGKRVAFDEYARRSALAESTPDAIDVSDLPAAKEVASQAEAQRRIVETEQKRLRAAAEPRELALRLRRAGGHLGQCR